MRSTVVPSESSKHRLLLDPSSPPTRQPRDLCHNSHITRQGMTLSIPGITPDFAVDDHRHTSGNLTLSAFFSRLILTPRRLQTVTGFWEELPFYYIFNLDASTSLRHVTAACAAAAYGIRHDSRIALENARSSYDTAIACLSVEIASCTTSTALATTILSVVLCIFYEVG